VKQYIHSLCALLACIVAAVRGRIRKLPKWIENIALTFVICRPLQSWPISSLCNRSKGSAVATTEFFELPVSRYAIVPDFAGHPGNDALVTTI
jgi:hypothetical protein